MKLRTLIFAVLLLAALSGAAYLATRSTPPQSSSDDGRVGQSLAEASKISKAGRVKITDDGKTVELNRHADGTWHVASYYDLPVDFSKLTRLIADLTGAKIERYVTSDSARIQRLEFKGTQIAVYGTDAKESDAPLWSLDLGRTADSGGRFVRYSGEDKAYLAKLSIWLDAESKNWADSALTQLKPADIAKAEFTFAEGSPVTVARKDKDSAFEATPAREGHIVKADVVTSQLNNLTGLRLSNTAELDAKDAKDAREHARTVKLTTFDNRTLTIALGRRPAVEAKPAPKEDKPATATSGDTTVQSGTTDTEGKTATAEPTTPAVPAGPVYVVIEDSKADAPVNALMKKRAVEVYEFVYTSLPANADALFTPAPPPAPAAPATVVK